jgi:uncharacterized cupredoxin-like copper-binding protein
MINKSLLVTICLYSMTAAAAENEQSNHSDDGMHAMQATHAMHDHQVQEHQSDVGMTMPASTANKTISVTLTDAMKIKFGSPLDIYYDDIVRFVVTNEGNMQHEFSISSLAERKAHVAMMQKMPNMKHEGDNTLTLQATESGELTWHFTGKPRVIFSCNIPGHSEAGMLHMAMLKTKEDNGENQMDHDSTDH